MLVTEVKEYLMKLKCSINFRLLFGTVSTSDKQTLSLQAMTHCWPFVEYSGRNSTKSPASGAGNVNDRSLMSEVGRVREIVCKWINVFLQSERWRRQCSSAYVVAAAVT